MRRKIKHSLLTICFLIFALSGSGHSKEKELKWFQNNKFGLFIHWGLYSETAGLWKGKVTQGGEHFMLYERIPLKEYALIANDFDPVNFDAERWVKTAKNAGMKYIVYTTKHHDGFAMYNSQCSDYNIVKRTPFGRDPLKELAEACHKEGIKLGLYYSLGRDWQDPDVPTNWPVKAGRSNTWDYPNEDAKVLSRYIERKVKPQLKELLSNYGKIDMIWFDTPELITKEQSKEIKNLIGSIQPTCLINSRIGNGMGDYAITEQQLNNKISLRPWEACITMGRNWGYNRFDTIYKSPEIIIRHFADIVSKGGNLLLNIGPDGKGNFPTLATPIFETLHTWLRLNGEAIYNTHPWRTFGENIDTDVKIKIKDKTFNDSEFEGTPTNRNADIRFTTQNNILYAIARDVKSSKYVVKSIEKADKIKRVSLLETGEKIKWKQTRDGLEIDSRKLHTKYPIYVLKIELD